MGIEIERKYIIKYPDVKLLANKKDSVIWEIEQTYLEDDNSGFNRRVRMINQNGKKTYVFTEKKGINKLKRIENEKNISYDEYINLLKQKNNKMKPIKKVRYRIPQNGVVYEIDVFDFWNKVAVMEVELKDENQTVIIPDFVTVIKDVTGDKTLTNSALSRSVVDENIFLS